MRKVTIDVPDAVAELLETAGLTLENFVTSAAKHSVAAAIRGFELKAVPVTIYVPQEAAAAITDDKTGDKLQAICQAVFDYGAAVAGEKTFGDLMQEGGKLGNC